MWNLWTVYINAQTYTKVLKITKQHSCQNRSWVFHSLCTSCRMHLLCEFMNLLFSFLFTQGRNKTKQSKQNRNLFHNRLHSPPFFPSAQFTVHVRRPGVIALQNVSDPTRWLAIYQGKTIGTVSHVTVYQARPSSRPPLEQWERARRGSSSID